MRHLAPPDNSNSSEDDEEDNSERGNMKDYRDYENLPNDDWESLVLIAER